MSDDMRRGRPRAGAGKMPAVPGRTHCGAADRPGYLLGRGALITHHSSLIARTVVRAPLRISFGGGGTDLDAYAAEFGGFVLSVAITRYCYVVVESTMGSTCHITAADYGASTWWSGRHERISEGPFALPAAALAASGWDAARMGGADLLLASDVRPGSGLGGSSAMTVALMAALASHAGRPIAPLDAAEGACHVEIGELGRPIGRQDQYASAFGGFNALTFGARGVARRELAVAPDVIAELQRRLVLFFTGRSHDSARILRGQRAATSSDASVRETLHRIKRLAIDMAALLLDGRLDAFGALLDESWRYKRSLSRRISSSAVDALYERARAAGALGGKLTGAGGGGHLLLLCEAERRDEVCAAMSAAGLAELPFDFDFGGVSDLSRRRDVLGLVQTCMERRSARCGRDGAGRLTA